LRADDQLLEINGVSLLGLTNVNAMETLRQAMQKDESNSITLIIARPKPSARLGVRMPQAPAEPASVRKPTAANLMPPPSTTKVLSTRKRQVNGEIQSRFFTETRSSRPRDFYKYMQLGNFKLYA
jgi:hypothetical protein